MKKLTKELKRIKQIDDQADLLSRNKMEKIIDNRLEKIERGEKLEQEQFRPITELGIYECSLPLPNQKDVLKTHMWSFEMPTGKEWLEITPVSEVHYSSDEYKKTTGIDVSVEAFNLYQKVRNNPDLMSFRRLSKQEAKTLIGKNKN